MTSCTHKTLVLLPGQKKRLQCRHCHLVIEAEELWRNNHCPECFDARGEKRYDFEEFKAAESEVLRYRCEDCGVVIESG